MITTMAPRVRVGALFHCTTPPERLPGFARDVERLGYDELWVVEDCFFTAAIATAAIALSSSTRISVGVGVLPAVLRNPAVVAMELAGLSRMFPGRLLPGFGHGVADWMRQAGAFPESQLAALRETVVAVRSLLTGQRVDADGRHVTLDAVRLEHPPAVVPPVFTGVRGARSLVLSGEVADGTVLGDQSSPAFVSWARGRIDDGRRAACRGEAHRVTVYALLDVGDDARQETRGRVAATLRATGPAPEIDAAVTKRVDRLCSSIPDHAALAAALPDDYLDQLCVSGSPRNCASRIEALARGGADAVVLVPSGDPDTAKRQLEHVARDVLPLLRP